MPRITADEINTQKHIRFFVQPGGPGPMNGLKYSGQDSTYLNIESVTNPKSGGINPINVHSPTVIGRYRRVGRSVDAPDFPASTVQFLQKKGALPRHLTTLTECIHNIYMVVGSCDDLSDFVNGWESYIKVYSFGEVTDVTEAGGAWDSDDQLQDDLEFTWSAVYNIGKLGFGEKASVEVYSEVIDVVYGSRVQCGGCGPADVGTKLMYAVVDNTVASPGQAPSIFYSIDSGGTWTEQALTGADSDDSPRAIDIVGQYLVVLFDDGSAGGYFYTELNTVNGAPNATWTKVTTGFVNLKAPNDMWVANAREVWISGDGGYIYKVESLSAGAVISDEGDATTENLNRIHGLEEVIVAVGESGTVVVSLNRGTTWATTTADPSADGNDAVWVGDDFLWWVGDDAGNLWYSNDQGISWVDTGLPLSATAVQDIHFASDEAGYVAYTESGPTGKILATNNGGRDWSITEPRLLNFPVVDRINRLAVPEVVNLNIAANNLFLGGLAGNGSDGVLLLAAAGVL